MASSTTIDVDDFGSDIKEAGMESLDFQDIPHDSPDSPEKGQTTHFTRFPHSAADSDDEADDKEKLIKEEKSSSSSFWTFAYYQQFFDVETAQVGQRIVGSMLPRPGSNYLIHQIRPNPDLYGPFWICTTLVFTTAIAGNLANYFSMAGKAYHWQYDFHKVTLAATAIFSYWWLIPLLLWAVLWWRGSQAKFSFLEMLCVYGYSLAIYVPISILWAIQVSWLQWTLVVIGAALSGSVLLLTFWPAIKEDSQRIAIGLMVFILIMHAALAAGFVLYFFYVPASAPAPTPVPVPLNKTGAAKPLPPMDAGKGPKRHNNEDIAPSNKILADGQQQNKAGFGPQAQTAGGGGNAAAAVPGNNANPQSGGAAAAQSNYQADAADAPVQNAGAGQLSQADNADGGSIQSGSRLTEAKQPRQAGGVGDGRQPSGNVEPQQQPRQSGALNAGSQQQPAQSGALGNRQQPSRNVVPQQPPVQPVGDLQREVLGGDVQGNAGLSAQGRPKQPAAQKKRRLAEKRRTVKRESLKG